MYAILEIGGKQYKVEKGTKLSVDFLNTEKDKIEFQTVTMISDKGNVEIGTPYIAGASVEAKVLNPMVKGEKLIVYKYKSKANYRRKAGHRQLYSEIEVVKINKAS
ncbi:MAG: 50S ribosomal protein L21 [Brevinematales bacterium]|nr:50S ribosomal protein L21 [Brevinematales bacterium]